VARRSTADVTASGSDSPTGTGGVARRSAAEKSRDGVAGHPGEGHFPVVPGLEHGKGEGKGGSGVPPLLVGAVPPPPQPGGGEGGKGTTPSSPEGKGDDIASPRPFFPEGVPQPRPFAPGGKGEESSEAPRPSGGTEGERKGRPSGAGNDHPPSVAADCPRPAKGKGNSPWKPARPIEQRPDRQGPPPSPVIFPGSRDPQRDRKPRSRRNLLEPVVPGPGAARRPAWLTGEQPRSVFVECRVGGAIVYPSRRAFTVAQLQAASNPLLAEVRRLLPTGGSRRSQIHFLVWPEGMRTYHTVYPLLDSLDVPKRRRNLQTGDDMGYILANE
jgi:hypothetical protein